MQLWCKGASETHYSVTPNGHCNPGDKNSDRDAKTQQILQEPGIQKMHELEKEWENQADVKVT